jgi:hypothetical protein
MLCKIVVSGTCKTTYFCKTDVMIVFDGAQKKLEPGMVYFICQNYSECAPSHGSFTHYFPM